MPSANQNVIQSLNIADCNIDCRLYALSTGKSKNKSKLCAVSSLYLMSSFYKTTLPLVCDNSYVVPSMSICLQ